MSISSNARAKLATCLSAKRPVRVVNPQLYGRNMNNNGVVGSYVLLSYPTTPVLAYRRDEERWAILDYDTLPKPSIKYRTDHMDGVFALLHDVLDDMGEPYITLRTDLFPVWVMYGSLEAAKYSLLVEERKRIEQDWTLADLLKNTISESEYKEIYKREIATREIYKQFMHDIPLSRTEPPRPERRQHNESAMRFYGPPPRKKY